MTTTSPHLTDETPHAIELNPYPNLYSELPSPHRYGRQSFENEEVGETLLTPDSQPPKLTQNTFAAPLERTYRALATWIIGPQPPRLYTIHPAFTYRQLAPPKLLKKFGSKQIQSSWLLGINLAWVICFPTILVDRCRTLDNKPPVRLSCVSRFWPNSITGGPSGRNYEPFNDSTFAFRCPATCRDTIISTPETVGDQEINYRNVVIGGPMDVNGTETPIYRGDSFICGAAIHAGLFNNLNGGFGIVSSTGEQRNFPSEYSNGISSIAFNSIFPVTITFPEAGATMVGYQESCKDPRWNLLLASVIFSSLLSITTTSPAVFFGSTYALRGLNAPFERTFLWLSSCWVGALSNFTFERLPIQRLTPHDLKQPGAILTVAVLVTLILVIAVGQAWAFRIEGRLPQYLTFYAITGLLLLALIAIPNMNLRLHHYIIALLLLPGTTLQTRPSLVYQGLLVGLFINGIARWGFDSILQTPADLFGKDVSGIVPHISSPLIVSFNITFSWENITAPFNGISILVNDVERFGSYADSLLRSFTYTRSNTDEPTYFRFGYIQYLTIGGSSIGDYTKPGIWAVNGSWLQL